MKNTTTKLAIYVTSITLGMVLILTGISWLCLLGCAITLSGLLFSGHISSRPFRVRLVSYIGLPISLFGGVWQFIQAERHGLVWFRVPPHWTFVAFILAVWLSLIVGEFWQWQQPLHGWTVRRLKRLSPDEREKYLARLDEATRDSFRKEIETHAA
jgi:hypothetical protein